MADHSLVFIPGFSTQHECILDPSSTSLLELEHYQNHSRSPSNLDRKVSSTHVGAMPWTLPIFLPSIPSCLLSLRYQFQRFVSCMSWTCQCQLLFHATDGGAHQKGRLALPSSRIGPNASLALPPFFFTVSLPLERRGRAVIAADRVGARTQQLVTRGLPP